jgi:hypothetical protein
MALLESEKITASLVLPISVSSHSPRSYLNACLKIELNLALRRETISSAHFCLWTFGLSEFQRQSAAVITLLSSPVLLPTAFFSPSSCPQQVQVSTFLRNDIEFEEKFDDFHPPNSPRPAPPAATRAACPPAPPTVTTPHVPEEGQRVPFHPARLAQPRRPVVLLDTTGPPGRRGDTSRAAALGRCHCSFMLPLVCNRRSRYSPPPPPRRRRLYC